MCSIKDIRTISSIYIVMISITCWWYFVCHHFHQNSQPKPFVTVDLSGGTGKMLNGIYAKLLSCWGCYIGGQMEVTSFSWNPGQPESFAVCMSDGSVSMWVNQGTTVNCTAKNQLCNASSGELEIEAQ